MKRAPLLVYHNSSMRCGKAKACEEASNPNISNSALVVYAVCPFLQKKHRAPTFALPSTNSTVLTASVFQHNSNSQGVKPFTGILEGCDTPLVQDLPPAQLQAVVMVKQTGSITHSSPILSSSASSSLMHFTSLFEESSDLLKLPHHSQTHDEHQESHDDFVHAVFVSNSSLPYH